MHNMFVFGLIAFTSLCLCFMVRILSFPCLFLWYKSNTVHKENRDQTTHSIHEPYIYKLTIGETTTPIYIYIYIYIQEGHQNEQKKPQMPNPLLPTFIINNKTNHRNLQQPTPSHVRLPHNKINLENNVVLIIYAKMVIQYHISGTKYIVIYSLYS